MRYIEYDKQRVPVWFGTYALQVIEDSVKGGLTELMERMTKGDDAPLMLATLYTAMAECAYVKIGEKPDWKKIRNVGNWIGVAHMLMNRKHFNECRDTLMHELHDAMDVPFSREQDEKKDRYTRQVEKRMSEKHRKKNGVSITANEMYSRALISGISYTEARVLHPGFISDMYLRCVDHQIKTNPMTAMGAAMGGKRKPRRR